MWWFDIFYTYHHTDLREMTKVGNIEYIEYNVLLANCCLKISLTKENFEFVQVLKWWMSTAKLHIKGEFRCLKGGGIGSIYNQNFSIIKWKYPLHICLKQTHKFIFKRLNGTLSIKLPEYSLPTLSLIFILNKQTPKITRQAWIGFARIWTHIAKIVQLV